MRIHAALAATALATVILSPVSPATLAAWQTAPNLAPYVPTPLDVVHRMLELADVTKDDVVYDLGCGDGRIVIEAAQRYGSRGVGIDYDPERIAEARATAQRRGVDHLVTFRQEDALTTDVSEATVVTLYLLSSSNRRLRPNLTRQLRPGARIVSHAFTMGDWEPTETQDFEDQRGNTRTIHLWRTDGTVRP
ncbi:MAG: class I SAM-dependent methyltransferase [Acidobacteria bacterium]|nr:class I SAM-dependent methyltransferase [Acidobacteriota bacterium]